MRLDVRIRKIEEKINTTKFEPLGAVSADEGLLSQHGSGDLAAV